MIYKGVMKHGTTSLETLITCFIIYLVEEQEGVGLWYEQETGIKILMILNPFMITCNAIVNGHKCKISPSLYTNNILNPDSTGTTRLQQF